MFGAIQKHNDWVNESEEHSRASLNLKATLYGKSEQLKTSRLNTTLCLRPQVIKDHDPNKNISLEKKIISLLSLLDFVIRFKQIQLHQQNQNKSSNLSQTPGKSKFCCE